MTSRRRSVVYGLGVLRTSAGRCGGAGRLAAGVLVADLADHAPAVTSYVLGLTSLRLRQYMIGTLASLLALLGYVVLGKLAGAGLNTLSTDEAHRSAGPCWSWRSVLPLLTLRLGRIMRLPTIMPDRAEPTSQR
ncbi:MAG: hypothetical protein ACRYGI_09760 [Janthinobacterium lividum]